MRALRWTALVLMVFGGALVARAGYLHAKAEVAGILIRQAWNETARTGQAKAPWPWADTHPVARMQIARIGYDEYVLEGASARVLAFGPARLLSSARPGAAGNLAIAGHRTSWFRPLEKLQAGDRISVEWYDETKRELKKREYTVEEIRIVEPADTELLGPTTEDALTLITCYPFGKSPKSPLRYIVRAAPE
ncbi:MAG TPA: class GN sortase [Candidatus Acidoferrum sp.]|nr:class GN sortase [Candidatus Acidoferrum sp.]